MSHLRIFALRLPKLTRIAIFCSSTHANDRSDALVQLLHLSSLCSFLFNFIPERSKDKPRILQPPKCDDVNDGLHVLYDFAHTVYETWPLTRPSFEFALALRIELIEFMKVIG